MNPFIFEFKIRDILVRIWIRRSIPPTTDPDPAQKIEKKILISFFLSVGFSLLRAEGISVASLTFFKEA
jgi:hypothetical protein